MIEFIRVGWRNICRKKFRSVLTITGIAIGSASVILIASIGNIGKVVISEELEGLGLSGFSVSVPKKNGIIPLEEHDLNVIKQYPDVELAAPVTMQLAKLRMRGLIADTVVWGIDNFAASIYAIELLHGRLLQASDITGGEKVCLVDQQTAMAFYKRSNIVGKKLNIQIDGINSDFKIIGVVTSGGSILQNMISGMIPSFVYLPYTSAGELTGKTGFDQIAIKTSGRLDNTAASQGILKLLERQGNSSEYKIDDYSNQRKQLSDLMDTISFILTLIAGISLLVAGLGIMTIMMVSVNERTREIGIKKAIGASSSIILVEFILEAFSISLIGSIIGCMVGVLFIMSGCNYLNINPLIEPNLIIFCTLFSVSIGLIFGVYPAGIAAKLNPVEALRQE